MNLVITSGRDLSFYGGQLFALHLIDYWGARLEILVVSETLVVISLIAGAFLTRAKPVKLFVLMNDVVLS